MSSGPGDAASARLSPPRLAIVVVAAGRGERLGASQPKALVEIAGHPLVWHAVSTLVDALPADTPLVRTVVVAPPDQAGVLADLLVDVRGDPVVVSGGPTRQASVHAGLGALDGSVDVVLIHDGARPFVTAHVVTQLLDALAAGDDGAVPGLPVADTVKQVDPQGLVLETLDRSALRAIQTPQAFAVPLLVAAHEAALARAVVDAADDAVLMEAAGHRVRVVRGDPDTFKVTVPDDVARAAAVAARWARS